MNLLHILLRFSNIKLNVLKQVDLVDNHQTRTRKSGGILQRLVFSLGNAENDDLIMFAQIIAGGATRLPTFSMNR